jgi:MFS family permease
VAFSQMRNYGLALGFICLSRVGMAVSSVLNYSQLLRHTPDRFRGRVFSTMESLRWAVMIGSMALAGICSQYFSPRAIGAVAGILSSFTAVFWAWADWSGRIREPVEQAVPSEAPVAEEPGA